MFSVLYVDDERDLLELGKLFLEQSPEFHIDIASSAKDALQLPAIQSFDAIVSDYHMPEMDGIEFLKAVRGQFGDIPFILFTGRGREDVVIDAINHGADFYLQKGGDVQSQFAELSHKIRQAVARRRAEHSLIESEKRLADIIDFLPDATFAINREGFIIAWNRAIEEMTGYPATAMLGKGDYEYAIPFYGKRRPILINLVLAPDDEIAPFYTHILRQGVYLTAETNLPHPKGNQITVLAKASPLYNREGQVTGAIEAIRDITERKNAEDEIRAAYEQISASEEELREQYEKLAETGKKIHESEKKYRDLFENSVIGIFRTSFEGKFSAINATFARIAGYDSPQEMIDAINDIRTQLYVDTEDRTRFSDQLKSEGMVKDFEARFYHRDGHKVWVKINAIAVSDPQGTVRYYEGTIEDIDDQKKAEAALKKEKTFSDAVIDSVPGLLYLYDSDGRLIRWNKNHETITGYTAEELANMHLLDWYRGDDKAIEVISAGVERALKEGSASAEADLQTKSGKKIPFFLTAKRLDIEGKTYFTGVGIDITDRKKSSDDLRAAYEQVTATEEELRAQYEELSESEQRIRESEEQIRNVFDHSPFGMHFYELKEDGTLIFTGANPAADAILGVNHGEFTGQTIETAFPGLVGTEIPDQYRRVAADGTPWQTDQTTYNEDKISGAFSVTAFRIRPGAMVAAFFDITERKRAEEALREKTEELDQYFMTSLDLFCIADTDGYFRRLNPVWEKVLGYTLAELEGKRFLDFVHPDDQQATLVSIADLVSQKEVIDFTNRFRHRDGTYRWLEWRSYPKGKQIFAAARDITTRKVAEKALQDAKENYRTLVENSQSIIYTIRPDGIFTFVSPSWTILLGHDPSEVIDHNFRIFVQRDDIPAYEEFLKKTSETRTMQPGVDYRVFHKDGSLRWHRSNITPVFDDQNNLIYFVGNAVDFTERKLAEEALLDSEARLSSILHGSPVLQFVIDRTHRVISWNRAIEHHSGIKADDIVGTDQQWRAFYTEKRPVLADLLVDDKTDIIPQLYGGKFSISRLVEGAYEATDFFPTMGVSGKWLNFTAAPIRDVKGTIIGAVETLEDITERRNAEQAVREANHKLNLLNRITRHDVANQLTALHGYAQIAAMKKGDPVITDYLVKIITAADTIARQIEFTRMYQELGVKAPAWISIEEIIGRVETRVPVTFSGTCSGIGIFADPMLERVFFNLFDNAVRHGVRVTGITIRCEREPDSLLVIVDDNGVGIPVEEKERIFERGMGKNTGLGLFLVREILAITGITIRETGIFGKGARFEISVPNGMYRIV